MLKVYVHASVLSLEYFHKVIRMDKRVLFQVTLNCIIKTLIFNFCLAPLPF